MGRREVRSREGRRPTTRTNQGTARSGTADSGDRPGPGRVRRGGAYGGRVSEAASDQSVEHPDRSAVPAPGPAGAAGARPAGARRAAPTPLIRVGLVLFVIGLLAVAVIMVLFFAGVHDLPLWANLTAGLAPVGFGVALVGIFRDARRSSRSRPA